MNNLPSYIDGRVEMHKDFIRFSFQGSRTDWMPIPSEPTKSFQQHLEMELLDGLRYIEPHVNWQGELFERKEAMGLGQRVRQAMSHFQGGFDHRKTVYFDPASFYQKERDKVMLSLMSDLPDFRTSTKAVAEPVRVTAAQIHADLFAQTDVALLEPEEFTEVEPTLSDRVKTLLNIGFNEQADVRDYLAVKQTFDKGKQTFDERNGLYQTAMRMAMRYPAYKFITTDALKGVLGRYDLSINKVDRFTGTIPEANVLEMARFHEQVTLAEEDQSSASDDYYIAAPADQFKNSGMSELLYALGMSPTHTVSFLIDDPILLKPVAEGYLIVTAWGDEAKDADVLNERNN